MADLPFLKNKNKNQGGGGAIERKAAPTHEDSMDDQLIDHVVDEFFRAIEVKDKGLLKDALTALINHIQEQDQQDDQEMMS